MRESTSLLFVCVYAFITPPFPLYVRIYACMCTLKEHNEQSVDTLTRTESTFEL